MGKVFSKYESTNGTIPYSASKLCNSIAEYAKGYVKVSNTSDNKIDEDVRDAVLVDVINFIASYGGCDFGFYAQDLYEQFKDEKLVNSKCLITVLINYFSTYMFDQNLVESVIRNKHLHVCDKEFSPNVGANVLIDFLNFVTRINNYEDVFTLKGLYEEHKKRQHDKEMSELKTFLRLTGKYSDMLEEGIDVDIMFDFMARRFSLKSVDENGVYHYTDAVANRFDRSEFFDLDKKEIEEEIYAMGYAVAKMRPEKEHHIDTQIIKDKILEMKRK